MDEDGFVGGGWEPHGFGFCLGDGESHLRAGFCQTGDGGLKLGGSGTDDS